MNNTKNALNLDRFDLDCKEIDVGSYVSRDFGSFLAPMTYRDARKFGKIDDF